MWGTLHWFSLQTSRSAISAMTRFLKVEKKKVAKEGKSAEDFRFNFGWQICEDGAHGGVLWALPHSQKPTSCVGVRQTDWNSPQKRRLARRWHAEGGLRPMTPWGEKNRLRWLRFSTADLTRQALTLTHQERVATRKYFKFARKIHRHLSL